MDDYSPPSSFPSFSPLSFSQSRFLLLYLSSASRFRPCSSFISPLSYLCMEHFPPNNNFHKTLYTKNFPPNFSHLDTLITLVHKWIRHTKCTWSGCQLTIFFKLLFLICKFAHFRSHIKAREYSRNF